MRNEPIIANLHLCQVSNDNPSTSNTLTSSNLPTSCMAVASRSCKASWTLGDWVSRRKAKGWESVGEKSKEPSRFQDGSCTREVGDAEGSRRLQRSTASGLWAEPGKEQLVYSGPMEMDSDSGCVTPGK
jgi:hypothetical protein